LEAVMYARTVAWWTILRIALEERLVYRGDFALGTLMRFLPIITQIFLWWAIFDAVGGGRPEDARVAGYRFENVVAYYLLTMVSRAFSSMPGLASGIALQIRNGEVKKFLIQPVDLIGFLLLNRIAHKLAYYSVAVLPFALVFFLCHGFFKDWRPDAATLWAFAASLLMGFLIGYFLEVSIGLLGFWFLEVSSLLFVYMLLSFFLSGHMFPLDMLPDPWRGVVDLLPLRYLAYFPAAVFLRRVTGEELVRGLCLEAAWLAFFVLLSRVMLHFGVRRYSGYGG
jgi:ABC-2 type transport system permease protein